MGQAESVAHVAAIMLNFTDEVDLLTRGNDPEWSEETAEMLEDHPIDVIHEDVTGVQNGEDGWLKALEFEDGRVREYKGWFATYGAEYNSDLARELSCEINDDGTIEVGDHGQTSVEDVYAVGDCTPGHNQVPVALGQGAKAGMDNHFQLRDFPRDLELLDEQGPVGSGPMRFPAFPTNCSNRQSTSTPMGDGNRASSGIDYGPALTRGRGKGIQQFDDRTQG